MNRSGVEKEHHGAVGEVGTGGHRTGAGRDTEVSGRESLAITGRDSRVSGRESLAITGRDTGVSGRGSLAITRNKYTRSPTGMLPMNQSHG